MSNLTALRGLCPAPFLQESLFDDGGYILGRFCASIPGIAQGESCCLPCPVTDWTYPENFYNLTRVPGYINIVALALCFFMLLCFVVLPKEFTRRHYLNVCLVIGIIILQLGFIVPWARRPPQCHNLITPNDASSSMTCAWGGAMVVFGGSAVTTWILVRALSMHLQICWDIIPGRVFFWVSQILAWAVTAALLAAEMTETGVSVRFGDYCHVNQYRSLETLWGPLLGIAGLSLVFQLCTFIYCLHVYLRYSFGNYNIDTENSQSKSSVSSSVNAIRMIRRVRKVVWLQWRGIAIAVAVVADIIFFTVVFLVLDDTATQELSAPMKLEPWLACLTLKQDREQCLPLVEPFVVNERLLIAVLVLLSIIGVEAFLLICRWGMITGWFTCIKRIIQKRREQREFVSLDGKLPAKYARDFELLTVQANKATEPSHETEEEETEPATMMSPAGTRTPTLVTPLTRIEATNYYEEEKMDQMAPSRIYRPSVGSFSGPRPPLARNSSATVTWDTPGKRDTATSSPKPRNWGWI